jgi:hypothetical protein
LRRGRPSSVRPGPPARRARVRRSTICSNRDRSRSTKKRVRSRP